MRKKLLALLLTLALSLTCIAGSGAFAESEAATKIIDLKTNFMVNPLGIEGDSIRFSWAMDSSLVAQSQRSYHIIVHEGSVDGEIIWDSGIVEDSVSTGIALPVDLKPETRYFWTVEVAAAQGNVQQAEAAWFETGTQWGEDPVWVVPTQEGGNTFHYVDEETGYNMTGGGNPLIRTEATLAEGKEVASARLYITALGSYYAYINGETVQATDAAGETAEVVLAPGWTDYKMNTSYQTYDITEQLAAAPDGGFVLGVEMYKGWYAGRITGEWSHWVDTSGYELLNVHGENDAAEHDSYSRQIALLAKVVVHYTDGSSETLASTEDTQNWVSIPGPATYNDIWDGDTYDARIAAGLEGWNDPGYDDSAWFAVDRYDGYTEALSYNNPREGMTDHEYTTQPVLTASSSSLVYVRPEYERQPISGYTYDGATVTRIEGSEDSEGRASYENAATITEEKAFGSVEKLATYDGDVFAEPIELKAGEVLVLDMGQNMVGVAELQVSGEAGTTVTMRHGEWLNDGRANPDDPSGGSDGPEGTLYLRSLRTAEATDRYILAGGGAETYSARGTFHGFRYLEVSADADVTLENVRGIVFSSIGEMTGDIETSNADVNQLVSNIHWGQLANYLSTATDCPQRDERHGWTGDANVFVGTGVFNFDSNAFLSNYINLMDENQEVYGSYGHIVPEAYTVGYGENLSSGWSDAGITVPWTLYTHTGDVSVLRDSYDTMVDYMDVVFVDDPEQDYNTYSRTQYGDWVTYTSMTIPFMNAVYQIYTTQLMIDISNVLGETEMAQLYAERLEVLRDHFLSPGVVDENGVRVSGGFVYGEDTGEHKKGDLMSYDGTETSMDNAQSALVWALKLGLYEDEATRDYYIDKLRENIRNEGRSVRANGDENTLSVGFLGSNVLMPVISDNGMSDLAYALLLQDKLPSWLHQVKDGATTPWERWNSYTHEVSFGPSGMNSFNHYAFGAVGEWMYEYMVGIVANEETPGFKAFTLQPMIDPSGNITSVDGYYDSVYGRIVSSWEAAEGALTHYEAVVPANTSAVLYLPVDEKNIVVEGSLSDAIHIAGTEEHNGALCAVIELPSGSFSFSVDGDTVSVSLSESSAAG